MKIVGIVTFITFSIWLSIGCGGYACAAAGSIECQMLSPKASSPQSVLQKNEAKTQQYGSEFKRNPDTTGRLPFSLIKDVLVSIAAMIASIVAIYGLSTWKRQLRGETEYELARRILRLCYKYRDAVKRVRDPWMMGSELVLPQNIDTQNMTERQQRASARRNAYANRWNRVTAVRADLYPEMLEAEVL